MTLKSQRRGGGSCELCGAREIATPVAPPLPTFLEMSMTHVEPTLAAPMPPSSIDFVSIFAAQVERIDALRPANRDRLFDG